MRALQYSSFNGPVTIEEMPRPVPEDPDALVEVTRSGLCRSDFRAWTGGDADVVLPCVPGHEFTGIVRASASTPALVGRRVVVPFVMACGDCPECQRGNAQVCRFQRQPGFTDQGSFAEYVLVPRARVNLVPLPDAISDDAAASLGCRFATAWRAVTAVGKLRRGESMAVFGAGGVGLAAIMIATAMDVQVVAVDVNAKALEMADRLGATTVSITAKTQPGDIADRGHRRRHHGLGLRRRGRHVQVGLMDEDLTALPIGTVISRELAVLGSHGMAGADYSALLDLVASGQLRPDVLVTGTVGLAGAANTLIGMGGSSAPNGIRLVDPKS